MVRAWNCKNCGNDCSLINPNAAPVFCIVCRGTAWEDASIKETDLTELLALFAGRGVMKDLIKARAGLYLGANDLGKIAAALNESAEGRKTIQGLRRAETELKSKLAEVNAANECVRETVVSERARADAAERARDSLGEALNQQIDYQVASEKKLRADNKNLQAKVEEIEALGPFDEMADLSTKLARARARIAELEESLLSSRRLCAARFDAIKVRDKENAALQSTLRDMQEKMANPLVTVTHDRLLPRFTADDFDLRGSSVKEPVPLQDGLLTVYTALAKMPRPWFCTGCGERGTFGPSGPDRRCSGCPRHVTSEWSIGKCTLSPAGAAPAAKTASGSTKKRTTRASSSSSAKKPRRASSKVKSAKPKRAPTRKAQHGRRK